MITRKNVARIAGTLLALLAAGYFARAVYLHWSGLSQLHWDLAMATSGVAATALCLCGYALSCLGWYWLCRSTGEQLPLRTTFGIYLTTQFTKYLPGNVAHHASRLTWAAKAGMSIPAAATTQLMEMLLTGLLVAGITFAGGTRWLKAKLHDYASPGVTALIVGVAVALLVAMAMVYVIHRAYGLRRILAPVRAIVSTPNGLHGVTLATFFLAANLAVCALALHVLLLGCGQPTPLSLLVTLTTFSASWLAGFLTPGAPAGLGVRETVMFSMLTDAGVAAPIAISSCLAFRLVTTLTDGLAFGAGLTIYRKQRIQP